MFGVERGSITLQLIHAEALWPLHDLQIFTMESLILAQNERWRRGLGMQVEREMWGGNPLQSRVANG